MNVTSLRRVALPAAAALTLSLSLAACGSSGTSGGSGVSGTLNGAGSTAQQKAQQAWTAGFITTNSGANINYNANGSGGGVTNFNAGAVDFAGTDSPLNAAKGQIAAANARCGAPAIEVPVYVSPIAIVFNVPGVTSLNLDASTIAKIFKGQITKWNDSAIQNLNKSAHLPNLAITPVHRSDSSGTTNNFTSYLNKAAGSVWTDKAASDWPLTGGTSAKGTSGVVQVLKQASGAIAYVDHSQAKGLNAAGIQAGTSFVMPSAASAARAVELSKQQTGRGATDYALSVERTSTDSTAYPITLVSYLLACPTYPASSEALVKAYLLYVVSNQGQQLAATQTGSTPLPANMQAIANQLLSAIKVKG